MSRDPGLAMTPACGTARRWRRWSGWLRAAVVFCSMLACAAILLQWAARARARELAQSAGEAMLRYARADHIDAARVLLLNGLSLHVSSGSSADPLASVLNAFHARCSRVAGSFAANLAGSWPRGRTREVLQDGLLDGTLHANDERAGYVACLDVGSLPLHAAELIERLQAFVATGDIARVGELRFVWARRERGQTNYVALWTEGPMPVHAAFPQRGDAPGMDLTQWPRPAQSVRVLSAWQEDQAPILVGYRADGSVHQLEARYRAQLIAAGVGVRTAPASADSARCLLLESEQAAALAVFSQAGANAAIVTVSPLR